MRANTTPPTMVGGDFRKMLRIKFFTTFSVGLLCAISSIVVNVAVKAFLIKSPHIEIENVGNISNFQIIHALKYVFVIFIGPILETLIFLAVWHVSKHFLKNASYQAVFFASMVSLLSWGLHGADWMALSRAVGFFYLSILFIVCANKEGLKSSFWTTSSAHIFWNAHVMFMSLCYRVFFKS
ncbi:hypothetical protein [Erythrobacter sp.]|uniref:hypothetical protein n=1 Tax=Erythrobacter sp. TaxID=1042 RepID=UPI002600273C|nr:hypothetical protein [Erythrobacter sp.]